jgi:NADPH-dependent glutamate synthase beta subunit-like oxidoreductase/NAD(P)H-flavin reductase
MAQDLTLAHGLRFEDLYSRDGVVRIDGLFLDYLAQSDDALKAELVAARDQAVDISDQDESALLLKTAPYVDDFVGELFGIAKPILDRANDHHALARGFACRRLFVQRVALKKIKHDEAVQLDGEALEQDLIARMGKPFSEATYADNVMSWMDDDETHADDLTTAAQYAAWRVHSGGGHSSVLFKEPEKVDPQNLIPTLQEQTFHDVPVKVMDPDHLRQRPGFKLTDDGGDLADCLSEGHYCIFCHNQGKDSCSKGLVDKKTETFKESAFGVELVGCPLEEKISEMQLAKTEGHFVGSLAIAIVDNPMIAGTGHRICNECMKACIYQKQEPVNIPMGETRTLRDVLELPWGFEIYSLLTRWNPLNLARPVPKAPSGYKVLVVGLGPAGFTLSHHLMNDGHTVAAIDGAKIEPVNAEYSGVTPLGERVAFKPVHDIKELHEELDDRVMAGFGGVAEYGITVRWDKNFLKIIRLLLERRQEFAMFGGTRFGGSLAEDSAYAMGFDHIALCAGAGKPTVLDIPNNLAPGVRQASDFLMGLQLTGAAKPDSITNLQVRLPVIVIGGGLTAVDTATESLAYYIVQVEKFLSRYETLCSEQGEADTRARWNSPETDIADEFLAHGKALREERASAASEGRQPRIQELLDSWGGATLAYRRRLIDAPSYTLNHEEVAKALEEGIRVAELVSPVAIDVDDVGHASAIRLEKQSIDEDGKLSGTGEHVTLPARTILVAAGTKPNTVLARERGGVYELDGKYFSAIDEDGNPVSPQQSSKPDVPYVLMSLNDNGADISFFGDLHPSFSGNVVSAMASAKQGYPGVTRSLSKRKPSPVSSGQLFDHLQQSLRPTVHEVIRLTPEIVEVIVRAPRAARSFQPGQFYRLQNFEALAPRVDGTTLAMEGLAMTGAWVDREQGLVSVIALEMGGSSDLCAHLKPGEPVVLMGPTGTPTEIPHGETVILAGGGLGNAVLFSIGQALRASGTRVLYFAAYKKPSDRYHERNIEAAADMVVWCSDTEPAFEPGRPQDRAFVGNIVDAMIAYAKGDLAHTGISLSEADRIVVIGSDGMMNAVREARHGILKPYMKEGHAAIGSINSPMQCMMKEICAQCLQRHIDPDTGEETVVFSCFNQDQPLDHVDFGSLRERLSQNGVQEKLTAQWIHRCLDHLNVAAE